MVFPDFLGPVINTTGNPTKACRNKAKGVLMSLPEHDQVGQSNGLQGGSGDADDKSNRPKVVRVRTPAVYVGRYGTGMGQNTGVFETASGQDGSLELFEDQRNESGICAELDTGRLKWEKQRSKSSSMSWPEG